MSQSQADSGNVRARAPNGSAGFRFSTDDVPPHFRVSVLNRTLARGMLGSQVSEVGDQPLEALIVECALPGVSLCWANSSPMRARRPGPPGVANGADCIFFGVAPAQRISTQFDRVHAMGAGEGIVVGNPGAADTIYPFAGRHLALVVPRKALSPSLRDKSTHFVQHVQPDNGAMRLLVGYLDALKDSVIPPGLEQSVANHVHDLLAVTLGATRDGVELAKTRGVRGARLRALQRDVIGNLDGKLSIGTLAARHRLTSRHVQRLFEDEGTTFTEFVREERLLRARAMLVSPRFDHMRIGAIAFEVGFGDLSYFIRVFTRRFDLSPGEMRAGRSAPAGHTGSN
jgi:AraC-like DNA-binding protein